MFGLFNTQQAIIWDQKCHLAPTEPQFWVFLLNTQQGLFALVQSLMMQL